MTVDQSLESGVYACPSCGENFQFTATQAVQTDTAPQPQPQQRKPTLLIPNSNPAPVQPQGFPVTRPGPSTHTPTYLPAKPTDKTIPVIIGSIVALCIVCITIVVLNSGKSEPQAITPQPGAKKSRADIRKGIEEKAKEFKESGGEVYIGAKSD